MELEMVLLRQDYIEINTLINLKGAGRYSHKRVDGDRGNHIDREPEGEEVVGRDKLTVNDIGFTGIIVKG